MPPGAAERFPDKVESDPEGARKLNVAATSSLAQAAAAKGAFMIYISTDYVFPGRPGEAPYEADSETSPPNLYGQTKLDGEKAALAAYGSKPGSAVVLRVPVLYGAAETPAESAVNVLLDAVWTSQTEGKKIKMDHWAPRYPTNTEDAGRVCHGMSQKSPHSTSVFSSFPFLSTFVRMRVLLTCVMHKKCAVPQKKGRLLFIRVTVIVETPRVRSIRVREEG